ncbi:MAG: hypothetical protein OEW75_05420 [Cyclobacteriaceae bacterium]|nr:hypothetical protein [Cyclobacteriaceae bacterium]
MKNTYIMAIMFFVLATMLACSNTGDGGDTVEDGELTNEVINISKEGVDARHPYFSRSAAEGDIVLNWSEKVDSVNYILAYTIFDGEKFGPVKTIAETFGLQVHGESMGKVSINQKGVITAIFRISNPTPENRFQGRSYFTQSFDDGESWTEKKNLVADTSSFSQSFFDIEVLKDGSTGVVWLDSRKKEGDEEGAKLYFGHFSRDGEYIGEKLLSTSTCQCCRTDIYSDPNGVVHIAFRKIFEGSVRDMAYLKSEDFAETFDPITRVSNDNWIIDGCPHTGPSQVWNKKNLGMVWFTMGGGDGVYFASKNEEAELFDTRILIDKKAHHPQISASKEGEFVAVYEKKENSVNKVFMEFLNQQDTIDRKVISRNDANSQYPVIAILGETVMVAWMEIQDQTSTIVFRGGLK